MNSDAAVPTLVLTPIGYARTAYSNREDTPVQAALNPDAAARIDLDPAFAEGLEDLAGFSHAWLVTWLHDSDEDRAFDLRPVPFLLQTQRRRIGLFATRAPRRPNPIGLSLVRVERVEPSALHVRGVDLVDGTPVFDIKPYVTDCDVPFGADVRCGWFDEIALPPGATPNKLAEPRGEP